MSRSNQQFNPYPTITERTEKMKFGKYKEISIDEILFRDPGYIVYMSDNGFLDISHILYDEALEGASGMQRT